MDRNLKQRAWELSLKLKKQVTEIDRNINLTKKTNKLIFDRINSLENEKIPKSMIVQPAVIGAIGASLLTFSIATSSILLSIIYGVITGFSAIQLGLMWFLNRTLNKNKKEKLPHYTKALATGKAKEDALEHQKTEVIEKIDKLTDILHFGEETTNSEITQMENFSKNIVPKPKKHIAVEQISESNLMLK
ncbi:MAG: hypothetical protein IJX26_01375 [Clostridia bacterium]|nr:hypothetical protein [Clostridia bacterium]